MNVLGGPRCLTRAVRHVGRATRPVTSTQFVVQQPFSISRWSRDEKKVERRSKSRQNDLPAAGKGDELLEFTAAPEIELDVASEDREIYNHDLPLLSRVRIVPDSPSYFSGQPDATDEFLHIQSLYLKYIGLPRTSSYTTENVEGNTSKSPESSSANKKKKVTNNWTKFEDFKAMPGRPMKRTRYDEIVNMLDSLAAIEPVLMPTSVSEVIEKYRVVHPHAGRIKRQPKLDAWGRGIGVGRRKSASAKVFVVKGEGEVLINGQGLVEAFPRLHDRESALWPLKVTNRMDAYNVWALAKGGGSTGQAEAITLGLAKALLVHEPDLSQRLFEAGCLWRDPRVVERKKPGHVKARKMPTWVKR